jgi:histidinol-phosphate aminotransferase
VDEAYIDFAKDASMAPLVQQYPNLLVMQTLSKAFGLAGIRCGITISSPEIAEIFNKTKAPYNISTLTSTIAQEAVSKGVAQMQTYVDEIILQRSIMQEKLVRLPNVGRVIGGWNANFLLVEILKDEKPDNDVAFWLYKQMAETKNVVVRFRGMEVGCKGCLRITIGTAEENATLLQEMQNLLSKVPLDLK